MQELKCQIVVSWRIIREGNVFVINDFIMFLIVLINKNECKVDIFLSIFFSVFISWCSLAGHRLKVQQKQDGADLCF